SAALPAMYGFSNAHPYMLAWDLLFAVETLILLGLAPLFPEIRFAVSILVVLIWGGVVLQMLALLLPSLGLRQILFGHSPHPVAVFVIRALAQGVVVFVTSRAAQSVFEGHLSTLEELFRSPLEVFSLVAISKSFQALLLEGRTHSVNLIGVLSVGFWYLLYSKFLFRCATQKRTDDE